MPSLQKSVYHRFNGGWATSYGPTSEAAPQARSGNLTVDIPFLLHAEDLVYELDGGPHKAPGATKLNSSALASGAEVKGLFDFWITGSSGTPTQHRVCHVGTVIMSDDADGSFTNLFTGLESGKTPCYSVLGDLLVMATDSTVDVPKSWDGTTAQNLAGSPPNFAFMTVHKGRMFAGGDAANPSRLYYCAYLTPGDWSGLGSGYIDIDPSDGDSLTGLASFKGDLFIFKGPYKGSIHRLTGSAPTGGDPFALVPFARGIGAVWHNTIFQIADDIGFMWSDGSVHTLTAVASYGDFSEASLTRPIQTWLRENVNFSRLRGAWAVNWSSWGAILFGLPINSSTTNNIILMVDYRFQPFRWASWPSFSSVASCLARVVDPGANNDPIIMSGGTDGFIRKLGQPTRSIDGNTALSYRVTTPNLTYANPLYEKTFAGFGLGIQPRNNGDITFGWTRDDATQQTDTVTQTRAAVLGAAAANQFTLGTSTLAGTRFLDIWRTELGGGRFRSIQYEITHSVNNDDCEVHSLTAILEGGSLSMEN